MTQLTVRPVANERSSSPASRAAATVGIAACVLLRAPAALADAEQSTSAAEGSSAAAAQSELDEVVRIREDGRYSITTSEGVLTLEERPQDAHSPFAVIDEHGKSLPVTVTEVENRVTVSARLATGTFSVTFTAADQLGVVRGTFVLSPDDRTQPTLQVDVESSVLGSAELAVVSTLSVNGVVTRQRYNVVHISIPPPQFDISIPNLDVQVPDPSGAAPPVLGNGFQPEVNGCGPAHGLSSHVIPNAIPSTFDFTVACDQHDACYGLSLNRAFCDQQFREAVLQGCDSLVCRVFAGLYSAAVDLGGRAPWDEAAADTFDAFIQTIQGCGGDATCTAQAPGDFLFDLLLQRLDACGDDVQCRHEVVARFHPDGQGAPFPPPSPDGDDAELPEEQDDDSEPPPELESPQDPDETPEAAPEDSDESSCEGELLGTWNVDLTLERDAGFFVDIAECAGAVGPVTRRVRQTFTFGAKGLVHIEGQFEDTYSQVSFTPACLARLRRTPEACPGLGRELFGDQPGIVCLADAAGSCSCAVPTLSFSFSADPPYRIESDQLVIAIYYPDGTISDDEEADPIPFCVQGDVLELQSPDGPSVLLTRG